MSLSIDQLAKPLKVSRRLQETSEAVTLELEIPAALQKQFHYQAGQFVTFFLTINGETISRSYSLCSSPLADAHFRVTVKRVPGGRGSNYLCGELKEGSTLMTTPPAGHFFKPSLETQGTHYLLFAAGSGITPVYSIMKTVLKASALNHVTLIYCNRNEESIIYRRELEDWARENPSRLDVIHLLSKPSFGWPGRSGRLDRTLIREVLDMSSSTAASKSREYYLCGPIEFMHLVRNSLLEDGVAAESIKEENFGLAVHKPHNPVNSAWTLVGPNPEQAGEGPEKIIAQINGQTVEVAAKAGVSILETLIEAGAEPPYSCMDGACMACLAKVQQGQVYQEDPGILSDDNIRSCETLTCQAKPLSRIVKISYDNL
jgi:ring-1,2-phenylacetyl-CoA epoxidase subunit PaaE